MKNNIFYILTALLLNAMVSYSQIPCNTDSKNFFYEYKHLQVYPPLDSGMPYDVLLGYIVADSVHKTLSMDQISSFFERQNTSVFSDSLKYLLKYFYKMVDYNPLTAYQFTRESPPEYIWPFYINSYLYNIFDKNIDSGLVYNYLLRSELILHVQINDTSIVNGDDNYDCDLTIIDATVLDTIKGKVIPNLGMSTNNIVAKKLLNKTLSTSGANFVFEYCDLWQRGSIPINGYNGEYAVKPGTEYILFLSYSVICWENGISYMTIFPMNLKYSLNLGMYPIENGNVIDYGNDWGVGNEVPVEDFKNRINSCINNIVNFGE